MLSSLPRLLLITDRHLMRPSFEGQLEAALRGGARLVQLREKDLPARKVLSYARRAREVCDRFGARLLVSARADIALAAGADGVHLPEDELSPAQARQCLGAPALCGVSVHSVESARRASREGADYLVFGSIFPTRSHPDSPTVGIDALHAVTQATRLPVFAVGGIDAQNVARCLEAGAHGVAVISAIWLAADVEIAARELIANCGLRIEN